MVWIKEVWITSSFTPLSKFFLRSFQFYTFFFSLVHFSLPLFLLFFLSVPLSALAHFSVKCSSIRADSSLLFFFFFFTSLSIPPSPTLQLFSTLCKLGFRQAGSYQATGYTLIGSVSACVFLPGSCMGLTAVMYCWLLIPWSQGGSLAAELRVRHQAIILFSG